jgi:nucleotide-binding universal stress UspA family protein
MKNILVPFDFTEISKNALDFAIQLAGKRGGGKINLHHIIEHPTPSSLKTMGVVDYQMDPSEVVYIKKLIEQVKAKMAELVNSVTLPSGVELEPDIKIGNPEKEIYEEVQKSEIDVVIMGTSGAEGLDEFFVGSNAERVVRNATCPVITLQQKTQIDHINEMVFASDFSNEDVEFVGKLVALQEVLGARLRLVKINTPASFTSTRYDTKQMTEFAERNNLGNYTMDIYNFSNEEDGIIAFAEDIEADMIALGTYQYKGIGHFLRGSIAEDVVNHATIPVWTYHLKKK